MKKWHYIVILSLITIGIIVFSIISNDEMKKDTENVSEKNNEGVIDEESIPFINFYDQNGDIVKEYSLKQINQMYVHYNIYKLHKDTENDEIFGEFYDENGLIGNPTDDIKEEISELSNSNNHNLYVFPSTHFDKNIAIGGEEKNFYKPISIIIEPEEKFESMTIVFKDINRIKVGSIEIGNFLGALKLPLDEFQLESYTIHFQNNDTQGKPINLQGGIIVYN